ncbi:unnamed protein product [Ilex paraguariensis]|uniref:GYF domain-containing protein n=1 Tax=Ilex paraguariensis TaxID=185542 RepID=A0ABC8QNT3_9AQUA
MGMDNQEMGILAKMTQKGNVISPVLEKQHLAQSCVLEELPQHSPLLAPELQDNFLQREPCQSNSTEKQNGLEMATLEELPQQCHIPAPEDQSNAILQSKPNASSPCIAQAKEKQLMDVEQSTAKHQEAVAVQLIDLSSDDDNQKSSYAIGKRKIEDSESSEWHCLGPNGERKGPHTLSLLKCWSEVSPFALKFKVWKTSQTKENSISLSDAIKLAFP